jgi:hypothetical protein
MWSGRQAVILSPAGVGGCPPPVTAPRVEPVCGCNLVIQDFYLFLVVDRVVEDHLADTTFTKLNALYHVLFTRLCGVLGQMFRNELVRTPMELFYEAAVSCGLSVIWDQGGRKRWMAAG